MTTINEWRKQHGLKLMPWGDRVLMPSDAALETLRAITPDQARLFLDYLVRMGAISKFQRAYAQMLLEEVKK